MTCGCPGAYVIGNAVWHTHPVTCSACGVVLRYMLPDPSGHICRVCARRDT